MLDWIRIYTLYFYSTTQEQFHRISFVKTHIFYGWLWFWQVRRVPFDTGPEDVPSPILLYSHHVRSLQPSCRWIDVRLCYTWTCLWGELIENTSAFNPLGSQKWPFTDFLYYIFLTSARTQCVYYIKDTYYNKADSLTNSEILYMIHLSLQQQMF